MNKNGFMEFDLAHLEPDPAVKRLVERGQEREQDRRLTPKERAKKAKAKEREARRRRWNLDMSDWIVNEVELLAGQLGVPTSQAAAALILIGLAEVEQGSIDLSAAREPTRSPRYEFTLKQFIEVPHAYTQRNPKGEPLEKEQRNPLKGDRGTP